MRALILLCFIAAISCSQKDGREEFYQGDLLIKRKFYPNGELRIERTYKNDSILHGYSKQFYESGKLRNYVQYVDGKMNGVQEGYFESGVMNYIGRFKRGLKDSLFVWFYENGEIELKENWIKGKMFGDQIKYYKNRVMMKYVFVDIDGFERFSEEFDSTGSVQKISGHSIYAISNKSKFLLYEKFESLIYIANPSGADFEVIVNKFNDNNLLLLNKKLDGFVFQDTLKSKGKFSYTFSVFIADRKLSKVMKDSVQTIISVQ